MDPGPLGDAAQVKQGDEGAGIGLLGLHVVGIAQHHDAVVGRGVERFHRGRLAGVDHLALDLEIARQLKRANLFGQVGRVGGDGQ